MLWVATISYSIWDEPIIPALSRSHDLIRQSRGDFPTDAVAIVILSIVAGLVSHLFIQRPNQMRRRTRLV